MGDWTPPHLRDGPSDRPHDDEAGLYGKFQVYKDGDPVEEPCFVLKPENDQAARRALYTYARATTNTKLRQDIVDWLDELGFAPEGPR